MDAFYAYIYGSSLWLGVQASALTISPTIMLTFLSPDIREPTVIEEYLSRSLGLAIFTIGVLTVLLTLSFSDTSSAATTTENSDAKTPYAVPALLITMLYHSTVATYCYTRYNIFNQTAFILGSIGSGCIASIGLWCLLFAACGGHVSKKTGADKRTSGYPFGNKNSAGAIKKYMKKSR